MELVYSTVQALLLQPECSLVICSDACVRSQAAAKLWPDIFNADAAEQKKEQVLKGMEVARPVIEWG